MKRMTTSKVRAAISLVLLVPVFSLLSSCQKESDMDHTGDGPGGSTSPGANEVFIQGNAFTPSTITVAANTTISWTNKDTAPHTVTSNSGVFSSGSISTNGTFSHTFATAGTYTYYCALHPSMTATVVAN